MQELLAEFVAETREMLEAMGGEIVAWEADPGDRSRLDTIFRFVHTVKGNCGFFDLPRLERLSHATEGTLAEVRAGRRQADARLVTAVLAVIDRITDMVDAIDAGQDPPEVDDGLLIAALEAEDDTQDFRTGPIDGGIGARSSLAPVSVRSIRLPLELLDRVMSGVSDLVLARNDLARRLREAGSPPSIDGPFERLSAILDDVREGIARIRMQRIEYLFGTLPRLVRDLSAELGKQVMIDIQGGNVELDREMIEMIRDPFVHIIRNAIDHGIERPSERLAAGKREIGLLHVSARQTGNRIVLRISDDGLGIDAEVLVAKAVAAGLVTQAEAEGLSLQERHDLIFAPGLSTAEAITSISGRGVGMDVVRANIERVGGQVHVTSTPGEGTAISLRLPLTLSIIPALTVAIGSETFALPRAHIEEIVDAGAEELEFVEAGDQLLVRLRGAWVPCLKTGEVLGLANSLDPRKGLLILTKFTNGALLAAAVDRIHDHSDLVIKPLAPPVMQIGTYSGTTLRDDGTPMLLLDINGLLAAAGIMSDAQTALSRVNTDEATSTKREAPAIPVLHFAGLDGRRKLIRMEVIDRIERVARSAIDVKWNGSQVAIDGRILPLAGADQGPLPEGEVNLLRLTDGGSEICYAIGDILETRAIESEITSSERDGEFECVTLVDGQLTELVDCHRLFTEFAQPSDLRERPVCLLPAGDAWTETILRPLVEAAGYIVISDEAQIRNEADIAIALAEINDVAPESAQLIRLHSDPECRSGTPDCIYRYDRAGLLAALRTARTRKSA